MLSLRRDKKEEEEGGGNPFYNLEKSSVLQECARTLNDTPIDPKKCGHILTKLLYIINQGETIGQEEATKAFFAMTKLFQSQDPILRRLLYLGIKDLSKIAQDVIIVTSCLMKDMKGKEEFRGPAIRALCSVTDSTMLQSIQRYMDEAIMDKGPAVASAALVSALHLGKGTHEVVKRWTDAAHAVATSENPMVEFHALCLLYHVQKNDKIALFKLVSKSRKFRSPYSYCLQIRIAAKLIEREDAGSESELFDFIESCLRHKSEMVIYEAAQAIVQLKNTTAKDLAPAVSVLQLFCSSPKPTLRFAAVRTLNKVAIKHPAAVTACNLDLENLITDVNRSIATLAITTLLKTGNESSVDRLMKQISSFMSEISDEFKIVVVQGIRSLCSKFPRKHNVLMTFLAQMLRDEGGFDYKKEIVECIISTIEENPEAKEAGLAHLCEFIEDCEHTVLATKILHLLGREGPRTPTPSKYIRFIYNRVILENAAVRAAAVSAIAKFGAHCEDLQQSCIVLLERCQLDTDDEVRDRATFYVNVLKQNQKNLSSAYILNGLQVSVVGLERALHQYTLEPTEAEFDMKSVPLATQPLADQKVRDIPGEVSTKASGDKVAASRQDVYQEQLSQIPELANLGMLFKSSKALEVTESETEYYIQCVKHTFSNYVVFQFDCTNTLNDQLLENVTVEMEPAEGFEVTKAIPLQSLPYNKPGSTYTLVRLPTEPTQVTGTFNCTLKFLVKDCDPQTGEPDDEGYEDEYVLEDVELTVADHVQRVMKPSFAASWEEVGPENELEDTYALSTMHSLEEAIKNIIQYIGLQPCERSDKVTEGKSSHTLFLAGVFRGGHDALVRAKLALDSTGVTMQLTVRSTDPYVSEVLATAVA